MLDPKKIADLDQYLAFIKDSLIPALRNFYVGLLDTGFNEAQALSLTETYLMQIMLITNNEGDE